MTQVFKHTYHITVLTENSEPIPLNGLYFEVMQGDSKLEETKCEITPFFDYRELDGDEPAW